ncbi:MAG TPA: DUF6798 domain-containing protein [Kofleriaceae bacterium]|nr:DUF6798 domain-containing protein [Kofleriaceae bacterium]
MTAGKSRALVVCAVAGTAILLTLAFAMPYGSLNQATYLLDPLHRAMPELYHRDWFVSETPPYLPLFGVVAEWLFRIDPDGPTAVMVAHVAVTLATYLALYRLVQAVFDDGRVFVIVACFVTITMGRTLGGNYLVAGYLQPASVATVGWVLAMAYFARARYLACGIALAIAGAFHANFLVLGIGLFTLAQIARRDAKLVDYAKLLGPQIVVLAWFLPQLAGATGPSALAVRILVEFHAPGHYAGSRLVVGIPALLVWQLAAFAALYLDDRVSPEIRALWRFSLVSFGVAAITSLAVMMPALEPLTQVRWTRIAPFGQLAAQVIVVAALVRHAVDPKLLSPLRRALIGLAIVIAVVETCHFVHAPVSAMFVAAACVVALLAPVPLQRIARSASFAVPAIALVAALWGSPRGEGLTTATAGGTAELELARWAREHTDVDALFLVQPGFYRFRLLARRAVVVDTKSPPLEPDLLVDWYRRLCAMVEVGDERTHEAIEARYEQLAPAQLERVARMFSADYVVVSPSVTLPDVLAYENDGLRVYRVR